MGGAGDGAVAADVVGDGLAGDRVGVVTCRSPMMRARYSGSKAHQANRMVPACRRRCGGISAAVSPPNPATWSWSSQNTAGQDRTIDVAEGRGSAAAAAAAGMLTGWPAASSRNSATARRCPSSPKAGVAAASAQQSPGLATLMVLYAAAQIAHA
ncbi:MAG TPA: hypothetical protein VGA04_19760 [Streptosporangiaceae bacterium]